MVRRPFSLTIYNDAGAALPDPTGAQFAPSSVSFSTGLPGGFLEARFTFSGPAAVLSKLRAGQKVILRSGRDILWWGWIEDLRRLLLGRVLGVEVSCLGPWQEITQRRFTGAYTAVTSSSAMMSALAENCPHISRDTGEIINTGLPITINWTREPVANLVKLVCDTGDTAGRPMLFALWEPTLHRARLGNVANLTSDPELEQTDTFWYLTDGTYANWDNANYYSAVTCMLFAEFAVDGLAHLSKIAVSPSTPYTVQYWHKWSAHSSMTTASRIDWYTAGDVFISSTYGATYTSNGSNTAWTMRSDTHTAPGTAATARPIIGATIGSGSGRYTAVDDVRMFLAAGSLTIDTLPRAHLWPRDLSGYDYLLYTRFLGEPLTETETARDLANYVVASYSSSFTAAAEDAASQALYRRRDALVSAGSVGPSDAAAIRDVYLAAYKDPRHEPDSFVATYGSVRDVNGALVDPVVLRAGDRLRLADGPGAGVTIMLLGTEYQDGKMTCKPEGLADVPLLLARS